MPIKSFQWITFSDLCLRRAAGFEAQGVSSCSKIEGWLTDWYCLEEFLLQLELNEKMVCQQTPHVEANLSKSMSTESSIDFLLSLWAAKCFSSFQQPEKSFPTAWLQAALGGSLHCSAVFCGMPQAQSSHLNELMLWLKVKLCVAAFDWEIFHLIHLC